MVDQRGTRLDLGKLGQSEKLERSSINPEAVAPFNLTQTDNYFQIFQKGQVGKTFRAGLYSQISVDLANTPVNLEYFAQDYKYMENMNIQYC